MDEYTKRAMQSLVSPLMDACESFLRANTRDGDYEGVEELQDLMIDELRYRAAIVEADYVRPPGGWDVCKRG